MQGDNECVTRKCTLLEAQNIALGLKPGPYINRESEKDGSNVIVTLDATSCIGHNDVAKILSQLIGLEIPVNRISISLVPGDVLVVGQYVGARLPEGATSLPEGARIDWYIVTCYRAGWGDRQKEFCADFDRSAYKLAGWGDFSEMEKSAKKHFPKYFDPEMFE